MMEATIKLFDDEVYRKELKATVLSCEERAMNNMVVFDVVLDKTIFFPEGGGQSPDKGTIAGADVMDVQIQNDVITHTISEKVEVGTEVECLLDWNHRFSNMQQHSGEHIFSGLVHAKYEYNNVGFHLSDQIVTMDFSGPLTDVQIAELEWEVNACITKNLAVEISYPSKQELESLEYRSKIEINGQVRIVTVPGYDACACCGTHVKSTGEIGIFKVVNSQNYKGGVRISMLCGFRALENYRQKQDSVVKISNTLSVKQEEVALAVEKMKKELAIMKQQLNTVNQQLMIQKIMRMDSDSENVCLFEKDIEVDVMRVAVNTLMEYHKGFCGIFVGDDDCGYRYIVGSKESDSRVIGNILREKLGAKGGGKPEMIQGSVKAIAQEIKGLFES